MTTPIAQGPVDVNVRELSYSYDLLYDIKMVEQLQNEVEYLSHRLAGLAALCREDGRSVDAYVTTVLAFPNAKVSGGDTAVQGDMLLPANAQLTGAAPRNAETE